MSDIRKLIKESGSITIAQFMEMAMYNSHNGYYINANPIGKDGDFITAPEISQLFGEMIGIYCADIWMKMGQPSQFNLVELGPGRGTLMVDMLRATKHIPGFHQGLHIHLVDTNAHLIKIQRKKMLDYKVTWHKDVFSLPNNLPLIIVANEFFDCLPINRYIRNQGVWYEESVALMPKIEEFYIVHTPIMQHFSASLSHEHPNSKNGAIVEICYPALKIMQHLANYLKKVPGCLLAIDYGYDYDPLVRTAYNGSLQAVKNHKFHPIFSDIGRADLTAHVDFFALKQSALANFARVSGSVSQGEFLQALGIKLRADNLLKNATPSQALEIKSGLNRLIHPKQMGNLFKVLEIFSSSLIYRALS